AAAPVRESAAAVAPAVADAARPASVAPAAMPLPESRTAGSVPLSPLRPLEPLRPLGAMTGFSVAAPGMGGAPAVTVPEGMPFGAAVTFAETMWKGVSSPLKVFFQAGSDLYADVEVTLFNGTEALQRRALGYRPATDRIPFSFNVTPRVAGTVELTVRFSCMRDGMTEPDGFVAVFPVRVLDRAAANIQINAQTIVSGTGASVLQHNSGINLPNLRDPSWESAKTLSSPLAVELECCAPRLTLTAENGGQIHLLALGADETLVCGRHDACDYVIRLFDQASGKPDNLRSKYISRRHFRLSVAGGRTLRVADGSETASAGGTQLNGREVDVRGSVIGRGVSRLELGRKSFPEGVLAFDLDLKVCDDGLLSGFVLARTDGVDERVLAIVNRRVSCGGCAWGWNGRCFLFSGRKIVPGMTVEVDGVPYRIGRYHQRKE
ncbi:MAG: FHA domain-containing protein, partial [Kiritimatiellae bacterium]|nr:FHA domain-containing protein [Kiritimatiellia bacterium]